MVIDTSKRKFKLKFWEFKLRKYWTRSKIHFGTDKYINCTPSEIRVSAAVVSQFSAKKKQDAIEVNERNETEVGKVTLSNPK